MVERRAGKCLQQRACRGGTGAGALGETRMQRPDVFVVLRNQRAVDRLIVPGDAPALQKIEPGRSKMGHEALHDARGAGKGDVEARSPPACAAVTSDQELTTHVS